MFVDLSFRIIGNEIPADHAYALYSSLSRLQPALHQAAWLAVHPINGTPSKVGTLKLTRSSRLRFRLPIDSVPALIPLAGKRLPLVGGPSISMIHIGVPEVNTLRPSATLHSRCVTIKVSEVENKEIEVDRDMFLKATRKRLAECGINGTVEIEQSLDERGRERSRRVVRIKNRIVVGYAVTVKDLSDEDSLMLQEKGLGGRRRMGCGIFVPCTERKVK
ncbi:MAG: type I-MYXAN CRISPR-associated protein Cas6/Cmx6 [Acidobacteriota bacterium]|nr:type I-MYXAN CRISPR-associated protein Cas6/Cmx6 [Acidobacteriota bacterium]